MGHLLLLADHVIGPRTNPRIAGPGQIVVTPSRHRNGIRSHLVARGLEECRRKGYQGAVVLRHPAYYPPLGFRRGSSFALRYQFWGPDEAFRAIKHLRVRSQVVKRRGERRSFQRRSMPGGIPRDRQASAGDILPVNLGVNATLLPGNQTFFLCWLITPTIDKAPGQESCLSNGLGAHSPHANGSQTSAPWQTAQGASHNWRFLFVGM